MTISILSIGDLVTKLAADVQEFKAVEGAAELEAVVKSGVRVTPSAYVLPLSEDAVNTASGTMVITQKVITNFAVVYAVKNLSDARGKKAIETILRDLRLKTLDALVGWVPGDGFNQCEFAGGSLLRLEKGTVYWRDRFQTRHTNES